MRGSRSCTRPAESTLNCSDGRRYSMRCLRTRKSQVVNCVDGVFAIDQMKRLILIFVLCGLLLPSAYGETISHTFDNGDKYVGEVKDGKTHGQGTYTWADGRHLLGEWKLGIPWNAVQYGSSHQFLGSFKDGVPQDIRYLARMRSRTESIKSTRL